MTPERDGDQIIAPKRAEGRGVVGDGWVTLSPGDPEYAKWDEFLRVQEQEQDGGWSGQLSDRVGGGR